MWKVSSKSGDVVIVRSSIPLGLALRVDCVRTIPFGFLTEIISSMTKSCQKSPTQVILGFFDTNDGVSLTHGANRDQ